MNRLLARALVFAAASFCVGISAIGCDGDSGADAGNTTGDGDGDGDGNTDAGAACDDDNPCGDGYTCESGECVAASCEPGTLGCDCSASGGCDTGLECNDDDVCSSPSCPVGTLDCPCFAGGACGAGLGGIALDCNESSGLCEVRVDDSDDPGVPSLNCYTPCSESLFLPDGTFRYCSAEGLMEGCLGALECVEGTCTNADGSPLACTANIDCPAHQACIGGYCLSNCSVDSDCANGAVCDQMVCRQPCTTAEDTCAQGYTCVSENAVDGVCIPSLSTSVGQAESGEAPFTMSAASLSFNNNRVSGVVTIFNPGSRSADFTITRKEHTEYQSEGRVVETETPLFWLDLSVTTVGDTVLVEPTQDNELTFEILPGEYANLIIESAFNSTLDKWEGVLNVSSTIGEDDLFLDYATLPDGQWTGTSYYFIDFDDRLIDGDDNNAGWLATMKSGTRQQKLAAARVTQNALLLAWTEFRTNPLYTLNEWLAVMQATATGSWDFANVKQGCRDQFDGNTDAVCYMYVDINGTGESSGLRLFTDNQNIRVPQGIMEMPFVVRLASDSSAADDYTFSGRMETPYALQYGGLPPATLVFAANPESCEADGESCLVSIKDFQAETLVGGRILLDDDITVCPSGFEEVEVPWLVPEFLEGTDVGGSGAHVRRECRETRFPFDPSISDYNLAVNKSLAGANPIPDGRVRRRTVELLDGVMVNQDTMLMLTRESFEANLEPPAGGSSTSTADFKAYSLVWLTKSGGDLAGEDAFTPGLVPDEMSFTEPSGVLGGGCSEALVDELLAADGLTGLEGNEVALAETILTGVPSTFAPTPISGANLANVHYLCHVTGNFDGRPVPGVAKEACPTGSSVTYFLYTGTDFNDAVAGEGSCLSKNRCTCLADTETGEDSCVDVKCTTTGDCAETLAGWVEQGNAIVTDLPFQCNERNEAQTDPNAVDYYTGDPDPNRVACNDSRFDLRKGKLFYNPNDVGNEAVSPALRTLINDAFRFKTRFKSRSGESSIGFVPDVCELNSDVLPYCYAPTSVEDARERVDCLAHLYSSGLLASDTAVEDEVHDFLTGAFAFYQDIPFGPVTDGFERLYSELLIMLGDEALTGAVASRFDLAGSAVAGFDGDLLEPGGIALSGGAGHQMVLLYRAHQYYQLVIDRFTRMSPALWQGLQKDETGFSYNFITLDSIATYFNRLILASTKKAQAASEIAKRYQSFNEADLARHVVERAFTEAYLESVTISQFMRKTELVLSAQDVAQLNIELLQAQRQYRRALEQMRNVYQGITDEITFFGDPPDYIPFPATAKFDVPAPRQMMDRAFESLSIAKERENQALITNRSFDVDGALFQSELSRIKIQYEDQLAQLCGTFVSATEDARVYPAISKYAYLNPYAAVLGDPCGLMATGRIWDAVGEVESKALELRAEIADIRAVFERVDIEQQRVDAECDGKVKIAEMRFEYDGQELTLRDEIADKQQKINYWQKRLSEIDRAARAASAWGEVFQATMAGAEACSPDPDPAEVALYDPVGAASLAASSAAACAVATGATASAVKSFGTAAALQTAAVGVQIAANVDIANLENDIQAKEKKIANLQRSAEYYAQLAQCCLDVIPDNPDEADGQEDISSCANPGPVMVNSQAQVDQYLVDLLRTELEASRAELELQRALGRLSSMRNQARMLMAEQEETEQHLINVTAAQNDPNVRIYANADVLNADKAFYLALTDAFRATRSFEYYAAQSYAAKQDLFLVRMAGQGEGNLEDYLLDLQRAFNDFEQDYGTPSRRVHMVSLRDDILDIPQVAENGRALLPAERAELLRERLTDPANLDARGYIRLPFATNVAMTSPLTSIHKLSYVEVELQGSDLGDRVGRVYLTAKGTSTIRGLDDLLYYHRTDPVTAVVNPYFNGVRLFADDVYQEARLKDRPFANTLWELGLNFRDEAVNDDVNVNSITDIRLFFFYEDFTQL